MTLAASAGTVTDNGNGTWSWSLATTDGPDDSQTVTITATDSDGASSQTTFDLTVNNVAPAAEDDTETTDEDVPVTISVLDNDTDIAGEADPLEITLVSDGANGTTAIDENGTPLNMTDDRIVYTPNPDFSGTDSFDYTISDGDGGLATATVSVKVNNLADLSGFVFDDLDNDRVFEPGAGEIGLAAVEIRLTGTDDAGVVDRAVPTDAAGQYVFNDLRPGSYSLAETAQPNVAGGFAFDYLDGDESVGLLGGTVDDTQDSNLISNIVVETDDPDANGYDFGEIRPSEIVGMVWQDFNDDGHVNFQEKTVEGVAITLEGIDDRENAVNLITATDADGIYMFYDLRPGEYAITESQPADFVDGKDTLGEVNESPSGYEPIDDADEFAGVLLDRPDSVAENYNFGERPLEGGDVSAGQTATIGFWQNKNGQELLEELNGGADSTQLGDWLAATLPNMYGDQAGDHNLGGRTNAEVADFYTELFRRKKKEAMQMGLGGPVKVDAQVLAVTFACYVTNVTLADTTAESYGFLVTDDGVGNSTFNVGDGGEAFGVEDYTDVAILDLLLETDERSINGVLYDRNDDGDAEDENADVLLDEVLLRTLANDVYSAINEQGDI